jgi:hypothetical protein
MPDATAAAWINPLISGGAGLLGVVIGAALGAYAQARGRRADFQSRQLNEFYGPLLGLRAVIRAHGELRVRIQGAHDASWGELVKMARDDGGVDAVVRLREGPLGKTFKEAVGEDDRQFREVIFPCYKQMIEIFRAKISLAEPDTRQHLPALVEFVEVWDRFLQGALPGQVTQKLGHTERNLYPLYQSIETTHDQIRRRLAGE